MNYLHRRRNAFIYAFRGLGSAIGREAHMKIHVLAAAIVVIAGFWFSVSPWEWCVLLFSITLVVVFELINTSIEKLCDLVMPQSHPTVKYIKDISAGAVLLACVVAVLAGGIVFWPYLAQLF